MVAARSTTAPPAGDASIASPGDSSADSARVDAPNLTRDSGSSDVTDGSDGSQDTGLSCTRQCDCPANAICSISGVCAGTPCTQPCAADGGCPCGHACTDGFCGPLAGSLLPCHEDCDCGNNGEYCVAGACVASCELEHLCTTSGKDNGSCASCGLQCNLGSGYCEAPGSCGCATVCPDGGVCTGGVCQASAAAAFSTALSSPVNIQFMGTGAPPTFSIGVSAPGNVSKLDIEIDLTQLSDPVQLSANLMAPDGASTGTLPFGALTFMSSCLESGSSVIMSSDQAEFQGNLEISSLGDRFRALTLTITQAPSAEVTRVRLFIQ